METERKEMDCVKWVETGGESREQSAARDVAWHLTPQTQKAICLRNYCCASTQKLRQLPARTETFLPSSTVFSYAVYTMTDDPAATPRPETSVNARPTFSGQAPIKAEYVESCLSPYLKLSKIHSLDI